jgi:hypothetical protein
VVQLLPSITIAARQELAFYDKKQQEGDTTAADNHRTNYQQRALPQVKFLCKLAGQQALTKHAAALLNVPCMPTDMTKLMQQAGLQLTTAQLVAAARGRVEGLESWVVQPFCLQLEPLVRAICCGEVVSVCQFLPCCMAIQFETVCSCCDACYLWIIRDSGWFISVPSQSC